MSTTQTPAQAAQSESMATRVELKLKSAEKAVVLHFSDIDAVVSAVLSASGLNAAAKNFHVFGGLIAHALQKFEDAQAVDITPDNVLEVFADHFELDKPDAQPSESAAPKSPKKKAATKKAAATPPATGAEPPAAS